ncbi:peptidylprolyl isomerase [Magnetovibrio sp.]|uniref:peptidylprolyl isomerase n=1 Tax=Magnetovibrio sp. TaxID=2024836 RepID=UPI002F94500D
MTDFISVNGAPIDMKTALQWQLVMGNTDFTDATIQNAAVLQYARANDLSATAEEIQEFFGNVRYDLELEKADDFNVWLKANNLDLHTVQNVCEIGVLRNKIRSSISDADVEAYFTLNKDSYDVANLYSLTVDSEDLANELMAQIEDGEDSFVNLALEHSTDGDTFRKGGYVGEVTRETVRGEVEAAVFSAASGALIGPIKDDDGYTIYMVGDIIAPELDDVKEAIRDEMFEEKLDIISAEATVDQVVLGLKDTPVSDIAEDDEEDA